MTHNLFNTRQTFQTGKGAEGAFYSLLQLEKEGIGAVSRLPISIRIVLESVLRNFDGGKKITEDNVRELANWKAEEERTAERCRSSSLAFSCRILQVSRFSSIWRRCVRQLSALGSDVSVIEPLVPVDLVIDHSVQVDYAGSEDAYQRNMEIEFRRNDQRYRFLKWGTQAFHGFSVIPPGIGIVHQVNLEYLARGVFERDGVFISGFAGRHGFSYDNDQRPWCCRLGRRRN